MPMSGGFARFGITAGIPTSLSFASDAVRRQWTSVRPPRAGQTRPPSALVQSGGVFPSLAPHVLSELDRGDLDAVSAAQQLFKPKPLGENATRDFLLRHVFRLDPAQIQDDAELLRALLRRHYSGKVIPKSLDDRLIHLLRSTDRWREWPLDQIVPSRANFLEFLQERWPIFVRRRLASQGSELAEEAELAIFSSPVPCISRSTTTMFASMWTIFSRRSACSHRRHFPHAGCGILDGRRGDRL